MTARVSVAVVGATGLVGEALLATLEARKFPVDTLYCLDEGEAVGEKLRHFGKSVAVQSPADFDYDHAQLVFCCGAPELAGNAARLAEQAGCTVIDCSGVLAADPEVPLVIPEVNPQALEACRELRLVASPSPVATALLLVLKPLHDAVGIERVNLTAFEPVSVAGKAGIDELASQTVALLNMNEARSRVFPQQIAFNVLPQLGTVADNGYTSVELGLAGEVRKILAGEEFKLNPTSVLVPVFYGHGIAVNLETRSHLAVGEAQALLAAAPGVSVPENGAPSPVADAAKGETAMVGRLHEDLSHPHGLNLWIAIDNVRTGSALNAVKIAELWVKCYM